MNNRDRRSKRHNSNWKNGPQQNNSSIQNNTSRKDDKRKEFRKPKPVVTNEQIKAEEEKIRDFKSTHKPDCCKCGMPITDIASAITDKASGALMHFDCALEAISATEKIGPGDKIVYIGQGRFGIVNFENPHDMKHFKITKIIEWEDREKKAEWRNEMAELYSHVK